VLRSSATKTLVALLAAAALAGPAHAQSFQPLEPPARPGPFDALPPTVVLPAERAPAAEVEGLRTAFGTAPPTEVADPRALTDRQRFFALPQDPLSVAAQAEPLRVRLLRITRTGRPIREVAERRADAGERVRVQLPAAAGRRYELRLQAGGAIAEGGGSRSGRSDGIAEGGGSRSGRSDGIAEGGATRSGRSDRRTRTAVRTRRLYLYTPGRPAAAAFLAKRTHRAGEPLRGEIVITGDAPLVGGACGDLEVLRDGRWARPQTEQLAVCPAIALGFAPGERHGLGYARLPEDLPPGRYRYRRTFSAALTDEPVEATAELDVVGPGPNGR
jgi:hypothetical protein